VNKFLNQSSNSEWAEEIVAKALSYLVHDPQIFSRFLELSGLKPEQIRSQINDRTFQTAILEFLLSDESLLLAFCSNCAVDPALIQPAHQAVNQKQ